MFVTHHRTKSLTSGESNQAVVLVDFINSTKTIISGGGITK
jgi:hypothetical protein